ncbi:MAG TPA: 1-(5-phosphoribosyl)-5-[(5-phosphoribosylamino)methylideneamino]imidazole-4-carboxamide isomerase [Acidimicrobiales bacterium]|nr:1-(5-phosphoribosyl)-5-[(5-phosphoribosylamino)methylideneamino]imidazole-4-carboxamide isomerase [Acidimicrobiales bacterium]
MDFFPAIDLRGGVCVRLLQGDYDRETQYDNDPVSVAMAFENGGAPWVHVVDLDAARTGEGVNRDVVRAIAAAVDIPVQAGGGIRDEFAAETLLRSGVARVVLGTAALEDPDLVRRVAARHRGRVAVGLDARGGEVAVRGWAEGSGLSTAELLARFEDAGVGAFIVTDIGRDGMMTGPDVHGLAAVLGITAIPVVASGGVGSLDDLRALAQLNVNGRRLAGVIAGRALYEGAISVSDAVAACEP